MLISYVRKPPDAEDESVAHLVLVSHTGHREPGGDVDATGESYLRARKVQAPDRFGEDGRNHADDRYPESIEDPSDA